MWPEGGALLRVARGRPCLCCRTLLLALHVGEGAGLGKSAVVLLWITVGASQQCLALCLCR